MDYAEQLGQEILDELERSLLTRSRPRMRRALRLAGAFLIEQRLALISGGQDSLICTRISAKLNAVKFAPSFNWM